MPLAKPTRDEVYETIGESNLHVAPGTDGLTSYFYKKSFETVGDPLTEVVNSVFSGNKPEDKQNGFGSKPKKIKSFKPRDKRRISLLIVTSKLFLGLNQGGSRKQPPELCHPFNW